MKNTDALQTRWRREKMLEGKTVVLGVTGSIAAYKAANIASMLKKLGADVFVIMTENATTAARICRMNLNRGKLSLL